MNSRTFNFVLAVLSVRCDLCWGSRDVNLEEQQGALDFDSWRQEMSPQQDTHHVTQLNQQRWFTKKAPRGQSIYNSHTVPPSSCETLRKRKRTFSATFCLTFLGLTEKTFFFFFLLLAVLSPTLARWATSPSLTHLHFLCGCFSVFQTSEEPSEEATLELVLN